MFYLQDAFHNSKHVSCLGAESVFMLILMANIPHAENINNQQERVRDRGQEAQSRTGHYSVDDNGDE